MIIKLSLALSSNRHQNLAMPQPHQPPCPLSVLSDWVTGDSPLCNVYIIPQHSTLFAYSNFNGPLHLPSLTDVNALIRQKPVSVKKFIRGSTQLLGAVPSTYPSDSFTGVGGGAWGRVSQAPELFIERPWPFANFKLFKLHAGKCNRKYKNFEVSF